MLIFSSFRGFQVNPNQFEANKRLPGTNKSTKNYLFTPETTSTLKVASKSSLSIYSIIYTIFKDAEIVLQKNIDWFT